MVMDNIPSNTGCFLFLFLTNQTAGPVFSGKRCIARVLVLFVMSVLVKHGGLVTDNLPSNLGCWNISVLFTAVRVEG